MSRSFVSGQRLKDVLVDDCPIDQDAKVGSGIGIPKKETRLRKEQDGPHSIDSNLIMRGSIEFFWNVADG